MMEHLVLAILAALVLSVQAPVQEPFLIPEPESREARLLFTATSVDDAAVGIAAVRTERYKAFESLWKQGESARSDVDRLVAGATPAGRVYGLLLLENLDPKAAARAADGMKNSTERVSVMQGCLGMEHSLAELAARIVRGGHVIVKPDLAVPPRVS